MQTENAQPNGSGNQLLWFAGAVGTTVGLAALLYGRRDVSYWGKTRRAAGQVAKRATEMNPWLGLGAGTAAIGSAALAYRLREPKTPLRRAGERAGDLMHRTGKNLGPWAAVLITAASAAYNAKSRRRAANAAADRASEAMDRFAGTGSRMWQRLRIIAKEAGRLYPYLQKRVA